MSIPFASGTVLGGKVNYNYDKAYEYYDDAEKEAQLSKKKEALSSSEMGEMEEIIWTSRDFRSKIADEKEELDRLVKEEKIYYGMTKKQVETVLGNPRDINKSHNSGDTREQWCYGSIFDDTEKYVYFKNGVVAGWED